MGVIDSILNALGLNNQNSQEFASFENDRISWTPPATKPGDTVQINYRGILKDSGANEVYLHYGFDSWSSNTQTVKMDKNQDGEFETAIKAQGNYELNFCFKDSADHWDNNNGWNWTVHMQ